MSVGLPPDDQDSACDRPRSMHAVLLSADTTPLDSDSQRVRDVAYHGSARLLLDPPIITLRGSEGAGCVVKTQPSKIGPGYGFVSSFTVDLEAGSGCVAMLLCGTRVGLDTDSSPYWLDQRWFSAEENNMRWEAQESGQREDDSDSGLVRQTDRKTDRDKNVVMVFRRIGNFATAELRIAGKIRGKCVEMGSVVGAYNRWFCGIRVEYMDGCLAVYKLCDSNRVHGIHGHMSKPVLIETVDLCSVLDADEALVALIGAHSGSEIAAEASFLTYWDVGTPYTQMHTVNVLGSAHNGGKEATEVDSLTCMLSILSRVGHADGVREELEDAAWQTTLWRVCVENVGDEEARVKALLVTMGGLLHSRSEVSMCVCWFNAHAYVIV